MKKTVLVTGGTGFLGRRLGQAMKGEYSVVLAGRNNKQNLFAGQLTGCRVLPLDVSRIESVRDVFSEVKPQIVIHAAATKFVDLAERQPMECVDVNVTGSQNVARVSIEKGAEVVVGISTDKATPPVRNIYGLSKALMERMFCSMNDKSETRFTCVRYGNVAWSTGSVLPIWKKMHEESGVIGTTGPEMRRFFFTVDEAVALVMTAIDHIEEVKGKVLSREMRAAQIEDMLKVWTDQKGGSWKRIEGRPGERDDEFLIGDIELPYAREVLYGKVRHFLLSFNEKVSTPLTQNLSSANAIRLSREEIVNLITNIPPEES
ncbi:MAG: polysaccharide biosynthesis protein [Cytophagales bacterium]|nr:polysaccharide biosynthesis protein [Cytophagales bacterium]